MAHARKATVVVEPVVDRLQPRGDVRLVVAGAPRVDGSVAELGREWVALPRRRVARRLDVVVAVDHDPTRAVALERGEHDGDALGRALDRHPVERLADAPLDPAGHPLDGPAVAAHGGDPARLSPFLHEPVGVALDRVGVTAQASTDTRSAPPRRPL